MSAFPFSGVEQIVSDVMPTVFSIFGLPARLTRKKDFAEIDTLVICSSGLEPVGDFGERMAKMFTIESRASDDAQIGDTFELAGVATEDDPAPDPILWRVVDVLNDDGLVRKFRVEPLAVGEQP